MSRAYVLAAAVVAAGMVGPASAQTPTFIVDCEAGQTIAGALRKGDQRQPVVIVVRGTCREYVDIARDSVTLRGDPATGGGVSAPPMTSPPPAVSIRAARVAIEDLDVTGGGNGIAVSGPFAATLTRVTVQAPASGDAVVVRGGGDVTISDGTLREARYGLRLTRGSTARVFNFTEIRDNTETGILAEVNSAVSAGQATIVHNGAHGVRIESGSQGSFNNCRIAQNGVTTPGTGIAVSAATANIGSGNFIENNSADGIVAVAGSVVGIDDNTIRWNQGSGVGGYLGPTVVMHGNLVAENGSAGVYCRADCTLQIGAQAQIHGNGDDGVQVTLGSRLIFEGPPVAQPAADATGNLGDWDLWCGDAESSVDGFEWFVGRVSPTCTGFD